jgi:hypothetical protein
MRQFPGNKIELISHLVESWIAWNSIYLESTAATYESVTSDFEKISTWTKDISRFTLFDIVQLVKYLIVSRNKTYDKESMKACKSLKAYNYFSDGLVKNIWVHSDMNNIVVS